MEHPQYLPVDPVDRLRFPADPWCLREVQFSADDTGQTETLFSVANGYLGLRGNVEEGRESHEQGTFVNGFHETWPIRHAEEAYGFARVGQTIINVPDTKTIRIYINDEPLLLPVADLTSYERRLDFRDGVLHRDLDWTTPSGVRARIRTSRMVSFTERHLAAMTYEVTLLDGDAPVVISSQMLNRQDGQDEYHVPGAALGERVDPRKGEQINGRVLEPQLQQRAPRADGLGARYTLGYRAVSSGMTIAVAMEDVIDTANEYSEHDLVEPDLIKHEFRIQAKAGVPVRIVKTAAYHTSRGVPVRELAHRCDISLDRAAEVGLERLLEEQRHFLADFWRRADVNLPGQPELQQAVRWNMFQILQATARAENNGIAAKGLTGSGYSGHYFWDTEIYVLPLLTYTSPRYARNALRFRYTMLPAARKRAAELNQDGALFPWRTINGEEASAYYAAGTAQYHIDADVAHAVRQYLYATRDVAFLATEGIDILVETARMWADLGFWRTGADDSFHIHGVTGPDEYTTVVNDNLFTNVMARSNLRAAVGALEVLQSQDSAAYERAWARLHLRPEEIAAWHLAAERMFIPFDDKLGIHPQDDQFLTKELWDLAATPSSKRPLLLHYHPLVIYRFQVLKQADVVLALYLRGDEFTAQEKLADFDYYDPLTTGDSTLSAVVQSIIASEVGYQELALDYFRAAAYVDIANLHHNAADGVHVASAGGVWTALVAGFGGFRDYQGTVSIDPRLPETWQGLTYRITVAGTRLRVDITQAEVSLTIEEGSELDVTLMGEAVVVTAGRPVARPLDGQPRLIGSPTVRDIAGTQRADGTVMVASVPSS